MMFIDKIHVLCTSSGNTGFPSVFRALNMDTDITITAIDSDPLAIGLRMASRNAVVAPREDEEKLLEDIVHLLIPGFKNILLPLSTEDQDFYSKFQGYLSEKGWTVLVGTKEAIAIANDKHALMRFASEAGFPVPNFAIVQTFKQLVEQVDEYVSKDLRCVLKLARGTGTQGVKILDHSIERSKSFWRREQVQMHPAEALEWFERYGLTEPIMITEFLDGLHLSVDAVNTHLTGYVASIRSEERHFFGSAVLGQTLKNPELLEVSEALVREIGLFGAMNLEYRLDSAAQPRLIEINPRFGASIEHTISAGLNLPKILVRAAVGDESIIEYPKTGVWFAPTWQNQLKI